MTNSTATRRFDPDELARLEEERDHLLRSLRDLDDERAAGDIDELDYETLKDDYTVRAADVLRAIEEHRALNPRADGSRRSRGTLVAVGAVMVFAVVAGLLVAQFSGQRGGGTLTGNNTDLRAQLAACQPLAMSDPAKGITCYQKILDKSPDNLDALTYQAWASIRDDRVAEGGKALQRVVELDPDYPDARVFRAIVATRAGDFATAAAEVDRFYRNQPSEVAIQVLQQEGLERTIFFGLTGSAVSNCWATTAKNSASDSSVDQKFLDALGTCLDGVLAANPDDPDALLSKALTLIGPDRPDLAAASNTVERILGVQPTNANALLLRVSLALAQERLDDAERDLTTLEGLPRPTASFLIGSTDQLRAALSAARSSEGSSSTTASTVAAVSTSTVPGAPVIPNASGG